MALSGVFTGARAAYSLRNLDGYTGDVIRARRSNDNAELDLTGAEILDGTLLTWTGANSAYIVTLYDQSNNSINYTQSTTASQARIVNAGTLEISGNADRPATYFDGVNDYMTSANILNGTTNRSIFFVYKPIVVGSAGRLFDLTDSLSLTNGSVYNLTSEIALRCRVVTYVGNDGTTNESIAEIHQSGTTIQTDVDLYYNGTLSPRDSGGSGTINTANTTTQLARAFTGYGNFYFQEFIVFDADKTADRADIYEDLRSYYFDTAVTPEQVATPAPTATTPTIARTKNVTPEQVATPPPTASTPTIALTYNITPEQVATPPPTATVPTVATFTNTDLTATNVATPPPTATIPTIETLAPQQVIAYGEFVSDLGREWRVEIYDGEAAVAYPETDTLRLRSDGFQLSYESPNDDIHEVIKASKLTATIVVEPTDTAIISMVTDIAQSEEGRFYMILKEWDGAEWQWYWWGQVVTDNIKEPDKWPSQIELTAIDGLGLLANVNYNPIEGGLFTGLATFGELIAKLIYRVKQGAEMRGTDNFIKLATNWYNAAMPDTNRDPMTYTAIRQEAFWQEEDREGQTTFRPSKANDVADAVFFGWNARIMLAKGYYHVEQVPLYGSDTILRTIVDSDGAYVSRTGESVEKEIDQVNIVSTHGGYREWARPLKSARRVHKHNGSNNILSPSDDNYETAVAFPASSLPLQTDVAAEPKTLRVRFLVRVRITNRTASAFTSANYITLRNELKLSDGVSNNAYLFKPAIQDQMSFINTQAEYNFRVGPFTGIPTTEQKDFVRLVEYDTPTFVGDDFDANTFKLDFGSQTANVNSALFWLNNNIVATSVYTNVEEADWTDDPYDVAYNNKIVVQFKCVAAQVIFDDNGSNEKEYVGTNSTSTSTLEYEYPVQIPFGDIVNHKVEPGAFRIWNGSAYVTNQNGWGIGSPIDQGTHNIAFHDIAVQQAAGIRHIPRDRQYFDIYGIIDPVNCLAYDGGRYAFIGGTFVARADRWTGFWQYVGVDTTNMQVSGDDIVMEPLFGFTNGAVVNGFYDNILNGTLIAVTEAPVIAGTITSIPILTPGHTGIKDDMTIIVTDPTVPISVKFTVAADVAANATSITVDSQLLGINLGAGSYITIDPVVTASAIGAIYDGTFIGSLEYWQESQSTSSPNNTVHASKWTPIASSTNADAVIQPKGTGALLAQLPNGATSGGNKRGANAVDLQTLRGNATQVASGDYSTIVGGVQNKSTNTYSAVLGGILNEATGNASSVAGGAQNKATQLYAFVGGGGANTASENGAVISGGLQNIANAQAATISGGSQNTASGQYSTVGGGNSNTASGSHSTVSGGDTNTASGTNSTVAGGDTNTASGSGAAIGGGLVNDATADYSTISGGTYNDATGTASTVGGGGYNAASQQYATIAGGFGAVANKYGMYAYGSSNFSAYGDNQLEVYSLGRSTTDATASILTANNSAPVSTNTIAIESGAAYAFDVMVVGTENATGKIITDHSSGYIKNVSGTTTGDTVGIFANSDFTTAGISYNINDTDDRLDIEVTGEAATTIKWGAIVTMRKVK